MKATITQRSHTGNIAANRKEHKFSRSYIVTTATHNETADIELYKPIDCRIYATAGRHYACVFIYDKRSNTYISGGGFAGGYGYHRASQAVANALDDAGVMLDSDISGRGDSAITEALQAIAEALGYTYIKVIEANGYYYASHKSYNALV